MRLQHVAKIRVFEEIIAKSDVENLKYGVFRAGIYTLHFFLTYSFNQNIHVMLHMKFVITQILNKLINKSQLNTMNL